jgi:flavin reductase (DIM6/NTAB) family NADH-FMN oxidoreductase RutF
MRGSFVSTKSTNSAMRLRASSSLPGLIEYRDVDKFEGLEWHAGATGAPILDAAIGYIEGRVIDSMLCGDHVARLVEPEAAEPRDPAATPLGILEIFARGLDPWKHESAASLGALGLTQCRRPRRTLTHRSLAAFQRR